jgi:hypothetical protein
MLCRWLLAIFPHYVYAFCSLARYKRPKPIVVLCQIGAYVRAKKEEPTDQSRQGIAVAESISLQLNNVMVRHLVQRHHWYVQSVQFFYEGWLVIE